MHMRPLLYNTAHMTVLSYRASSLSHKDGLLNLIGNVDGQIFIMCLFRCVNDSNFA